VVYGVDTHCVDRLKGKFGEIPTRSLHCDGERRCTTATVSAMGREGGSECEDPEPGDLP